MQKREEFRLLCLFEKLTCELPKMCFANCSLRGLEDRIRRGTVKGNSVADVRFTAGQVMWRWMQSDLMQHLHCLEAK
jgi:hypothetical protein